MKFLGVVQKTMPMKVTMITTLDALVNELVLPSISLQGNFSDITQTGVNFTGKLTITNPYSFDLRIENLTTTVLTNTGLSVGSLIMQGKTILAQTTQQIDGSGRLLLKALDAKTLHMTVNGTVTILVAGIQKSMNLSMNTDIVVPTIDRLFSHLPTDTSFTAISKIRVKGLLEQITFEIFNPNNLTFIVHDITLSIIRVDYNKTRLLCNSTLPDTVFLPQSKTKLYGEMIIPYGKLLIPRKGERLLADSLQVIMRENITIQGLNQTIWVGMIGYQNFPFRR
jgi:hypothetical protein